MYHTTAQHTHADEEITIRLGSAAEAGGVRRLAELDTSPVPAGELLVALVGNEVRAAIAIRSGHAIADPFHRTDQLVALLAERAAQLRGDSHRGLRARLTRRSRSRRPGLSPQPAGTLRALH